MDDEEALFNVYGNEHNKSDIDSYFKCKSNIVFFVTFKCFKLYPILNIFHLPQIPIFQIKSNLNQILTFQIKLNLSLIFESLSLSILNTGTNGVYFANLNPFKAVINKTSTSNPTNNTPKISTSSSSKSSSNQLSTNSEPDIYVNYDRFDSAKYRLPIHSDSNSSNNTSSHNNISDSPLNVKISKLSNPAPLKPPRRRSKTRNHSRIPIKPHYDDSDSYFNGCSSLSTLAMKYINKSIKILLFLGGGRENEDPIIFDSDVHHKHLSLMGHSPCYSPNHLSLLLSLNINSISHELPNSNNSSLSLQNKLNPTNFNNFCNSSHLLSPSSSESNINHNAIPIPSAVISFDSNRENKNKPNYHHNTTNNPSHAISHIRNISKLNNYQIRSNPVDSPFYRLC